MNISDKEFASMFAKTLESTRVLRQTARIPEETGEEGDTSYVFILNRKSGGIRAHFLSLHPYKGYILPHIQHVTWPKLKGWMDFRAVVYKNVLYIMGGKERETGKYTARMMKYDPTEDKWSNLSFMKRQKAFFTINILDRRIIITGGETNDGETTDVIESYEPLIDTWSFEGRLPEPRKHHSSVVLNNKLYICGGHGPNSAYNYNIWELRREFRMVGEKETFQHHWYNEWGHVFNRKIQQTCLFTAEGKLFTVGGLVQGPTEDGKLLTDELDLDDPNSDVEEEEEKKKQRKTQPFVPSYLRMLAEDSQHKKKGPKNITRTTRRLCSIDVANNYLKHKNPYKAMATEKRMLRARAGATALHVGKRVYVFGGYQLEDERLYVPRVEYYHVKKKRWFTAFDLSTFDNESFREVDVHLLQLPNANPNFRVMTTAYKYPLW
ncbi:uncharacterized protein [Watersipora subatra]|uniref:uncharacterized protein n=1 Tax=Watersipora subatra TaxID=2589382 RepID=UPI00355AEB08